MTERAAPGSEIEIDFETLFRAAPAGSVITDAAHTILDVNDAFSTWTGLDRASLIGTSFLRLLPVGDRILFSTRAQPLLDLTGRIPETATTILGRDRTPLRAALGASRFGTDPAVTVYLMGPRRERSSEESLLLSAVHRAEDSDARRQEAERDLEHQTRHDQLTGLPNRAGLLAALPGFDAGQELTGYWIGLDHFRVINESLGRTAGDEILTIIAGRLQQRHATDALLARVGGDEFVVLSADAGHAEALLELVAEPIQVEELEIVVTASIGTATASGPPLATASALDPAAAPSPGAFDPVAAVGAVLRNAGMGMYEAKAAGRNRWKHVTADTDDSAVDEIRLLGEIRAAIAGDQLRLDYQPQLDLRTGRPYGFEALVRWEHPDRGLIGPSGFIDVAEKTGLISQLGTWACRTAIARMSELDRLAAETAEAFDAGDVVEAVGTADAGADAATEAGTPGDPPVHAAARTPVHMSVNIAARQLSDTHFAETVESLLAATGVRPSQLTLEITETGIITDAPQALENLRRLSGLGIRLSIDDFGTGHAGFSYLNDLPVDEIKIDRSYIAQLDTSPEAAAIVVSCIDLAHALGLTVVAEGVETEAQLAHLTALGCDVVQGYHYSRPLPPDAVMPFLRRESEAAATPDR